MVRNIDNATGNIARTTNGWREDEKYLVKFVSDTSGSGNDYAVFDSANPRTGRLVLKFGNSATTGRCHIDSCDGVGATISAQYSKHIIKVKPSTTYKLTFYAKIVNRTTGNIFSRNFYNGLTRVSNSNYINIGGTIDWTKYEQSLTTPSNCDGLVIRFQNATGATEETYLS